MATKIIRSEYVGAVGIANRFRQGIGAEHVSACRIFEEKTALDGKPVRRLGGQAPSGYVSTRGAAGALNTLFLDNVHNGATVAQCLEVVKATVLNDGRGNREPLDKLTDHVKSFFIQADRKRAAVNGLVKAIQANGWDYAKIEEKAVLLDGVAWNGLLFKRSITPNTVIVPTVLIALHYKRTPSLAKALGIED